MMYTRIIEPIMTSVTHYVDYITPSLSRVLFLTVENTQCFLKYCTTSSFTATSDATKLFIRSPLSSYRNPPVHQFLT